MNNNIDNANQEFWDELCGGGFAKYLGIKDHSLESLASFDNGYLDFYPYLLNRIRVDEMVGKNVLEIGLGYGTLGQKIAESGAVYTGLDIAEGPVRMMNHRLAMQELPGKAIKGSMLNCPLPSESLDYIVSIGCFHHTGDVQRCIDESYRVLKPGGTVFIMVYNQFSYLQWKRWPLKTLGSMMHNLDIIKQKPEVCDKQRGAYDTNAEGKSAPETEFISIRQLRSMFKRYSSAEFNKENCNSATFFGKEIVKRELLLPNLGKWMGLDIYVEAKK